MLSLVAVVRRTVLVMAEVRTAYSAGDNPGIVNNKMPCSGPYNTVAAAVGLAVVRVVLAVVLVELVQAQAVVLMRSMWDIADEAAQLLTDIAAYSLLWAVAHNIEVELLAHSDMSVVLADTPALLIDNAAAADRHWRHSSSRESIPQDIHSRIHHRLVASACEHEPPSLPHSVAAVVVACASSDRRVANVVEWSIVHH
jgi:ABC-type nickel/cobalt efflux system permease component RcnA